MYAKQKESTLKSLYQVSDLISSNKCFQNELIDLGSSDLFNFFCSEAGITPQ